MAMFILGVLMIAGEYRQRTILTTFLAEPRRGRVSVAKLVTTGVLGAVIAAIGYAGGRDHRRPDLREQGRAPRANRHRLGWSWAPSLSGACYGLLGVAVGALTRNTVAAIISGLIWIQLVEVAILESAVPSLAKWLPAGAAQGLTAVVKSSHNLPQATAAAVLVAWAVAVVALATKMSVRRELR